MEFSSKKIGARIHNYCNMNNISLDEFAKKNETTRTMAGRIFDGRIIFTPNNLNDILTKINTNLDKLMSEEYKPQIISERKKFIDCKNENKIFGIIDDYVFLNEVIDKD